jgi:hypothetical protein
LPALHTGSWIDADFHIWIGHPEKNEAWQRIARARADLVASGLGVAEAPSAWESLDAAEGSDWFWWLGIDHHVPAWLAEPIVRVAEAAGEGTPLGYVRPTLDGRETSYFEWRSAGRRSARGGAAMHQGEAAIRDLYYGFDERRLYLRVDAATAARAAATRLEVRIRSENSEQTLEADVRPGRHGVRRVASEGVGAPLEDAVCVCGERVELGIPLASLGLAAGGEIAIAVTLRDASGVLGELAAGDGDPIRITGPEDEAAQWSA